MLIVLAPRPKIAKILNLETHSLFAKKSKILAIFSQMKSL